MARFCRNLGFRHPFECARGVFDHVERAPEGISIATAEAIREDARSKEKKLLEEVMENEKHSAIFFVRLDDGSKKDQRIYPGEEGEEFKEHSHYKVDYYTNLPTALGKKAEQNYGLHEMGLPKDVRQIQITVKKTGKLVHAYLHSDEKWYDTRGERAFIHQNDTIEILSRKTLDVSGKPKPTIPSREGPKEKTKDELAAEAQTREAEAIETHNQELEETLQAALERTRTASRKVNRKSSIAIPEYLWNLRQGDYEKQLKDMQYGEQVWQALQELASLSPEAAKQPLDLLEEWVHEFREDNKKIGFKEICVSLYGPVSGPNMAMRRYAELEKEVQLVDEIARPIVSQEINAYLSGTSEFAYAEELKQELEPETEGEKPKGQKYRRLFRDYLYKKIQTEVANRGLTEDHNAIEIKAYMNAVLPSDFRAEPFRNSNRIDRLYEQLSSLETLFRASYSFLDALQSPSGLSYQGSDGAVDYKGGIDRERSPEELELLHLIENTTILIFDPNDHGPTVKGDAGRTLNMANLNERFAVDQKDEVQRQMERYVTNASAHRQLRYEGIISNGKINTKRYCEYLGYLRELGWTKAASNKKLAKLYPDHPTTPIEVTQNAEGKKEITLSPEDMELIRLGMAMDQTLRFIDDKQYAEDYLDQQKTNFLETQNPAVAGLLNSLDSEYELTHEDFVSIANSVKQVHLGAAGVIAQREEHTDYSQTPRNPEVTVERQVGAGYMYTETIKLRNGVVLKHHAEIHGKILSHTIGAGTGFGVSKDLNDRVTLGAEAYVTLGWQGRGNGFGGAAAGGVLQMDIDLGKYQTTQLSLELGAGAANGLLYLTQGVGIKKDLGAMAIKETMEIEKEMHNEMDRRLTIFMEDHATVFESMDEAQKAEFKAGLVSHYVRDLMAQGMDNMDNFEWVSGEIKTVEVWGPLGPRFGVIFAVTGGLKGSPTVSYAVPAGAPELDDIAAANLAEQLAKENRLPEPKIYPIYTSGHLQLTETGQKTIVEGVWTPIRPTDTLELINEALAIQGLALERVGERLRLNVTREDLDGIVSLYGDPASGVEPYVDKNDGYVYLNLANDQEFYFNSNMVFTPADNFGQTQELELYLTKNPHVTPKTIKYQTKDVIRWQQSGRDHKQSPAWYVKRVTDTHRSRDRGGYESREAFAAENHEENYFDETQIQALEAARGRMQTALKIAKEGEPSETFDVLNSFVNDYLKKNTVDYYKLTLDEQYYGDTIKGIQNEATNNSTFKHALSGKELTYVMQLLLSNSRAQMSKKLEERVQHIVSWNQRALTHHLVAQGVEPYDVAQGIAEKIMTVYAQEITTAEKEPLKRTQENSLGLLHTLLGPQATGFFGEGILESGDVYTHYFYGLTDLTEENLRDKFKLDPKEIAIFMAAQEAEMAPLDAEKPSEFIQTELGLGVLDAAHVIWGAETTQLLAEIVEKQPKTVEDINADPNSALRKAWKEYTDMVIALRAHKTIKLGAITLTTELEQQLGFLAACCNFTTTWKENFSIIEEKKVSPGADTETYGYIEGAENVKYGTATLAGGAVLKETVTPYTPPPPEVPPIKKPPLGEKIPGVIGGSVKPNTGSDTVGDEEHEDDSAGGGGVFE